MADDSKPTCFIIMPLTVPEHSLERYGAEDHFREVLEHLVKPAVSEAGFEPLSPLADDAEVIQAQVIKKLCEADLVLCDFSVLNPNVMYELGIRTSVNRPAVHIRDAHTTQLPFDVGLVNCHTYDPNLRVGAVKRQIPSLAAHIRKSWARATEGSGEDGPKNAMWKVFGIETAARLATDVGTEDKLDLLLRRVEEQGEWMRSFRSASRRGVPRDRPPAGPFTIRDSGPADSQLERDVDSLIKWIDGAPEDLPAARYAEVIQSWADAFGISISAQNDFVCFDIPSAPAPRAGLRRALEAVQAALLRRDVPSLERVRP